MMTESELPYVQILSWLFVISNAGRIAAYLPQIMAAWRCPAGAKSVSLLTWSYFAFAHLTALLYAIFVLHDPRATWIFAGNLSVTACLVSLLLWKRLQYLRTDEAPRFVAKIARQGATDGT
jgi:uncharacterized protein with PQ loop repeat